MISVLGLELDIAIGRLEALGYDIEVLEVRSKKGQQGDQVRVIKQELTGDNRLRLSYSSFITETKE